MTDGLPPRGPTASGLWSSGPDRPRPPPAGHHRPLAPRATSRWSTPSSGSPSSSTAASTTTAQLRARARGRGLPVLLDQRHRGDPQGVPPLGRRRSSTTWSACSPSASSSATQVGASSPATGSASSPSTWRDGRRPAVRLDPARARRRRRRRHDHRPGRPAPLPDLPRRGSRAPHDPRRRAQAPAGDRPRRRARRPPPASDRTGTADRGPNARAPDRRRVAGGGRGRAARSPSSAGSWPTCPSACCSRAGSTPA